MFLTPEQTKAQIDALTDEQKQWLAKRSEADKKQREIGKKIKELEGQLIQHMFSKTAEAAQAPAEAPTTNTTRRRNAQA